MLGDTGLWEIAKLLLRRRLRRLGGWTYCFVVRVKVKPPLIQREIIDTRILMVEAAVIGTVEELAASPSTLTLVRDQFETNFFGPVNIIKAVLPAMRERKSGHIIALTGISLLLFTYSIQVAYL